MNNKCLLLLLVAFILATACEDDQSSSTPVDSNAEQTTLDNNLPTASWQPDPETLVFRLWRPGRR